MDLLQFNNFHNVSPYPLAKWLNIHKPDTIYSVLAEQPGGNSFVLIVSYGSVLISKLEHLSKGEMVDILTKEIACVIGGLYGYSTKDS